MRTQTLLLAAVVVVVNACTSLVVQQAPVHEVIGAKNRPKDVVLRLKDGRRVALWKATIVGDRIVGRTRDIKPRTLAVARSDIATVATRRREIVAYLALAYVAASFAVTAAFAYAWGD